MTGRTRIPPPPPEDQGALFDLVPAAAVEASPAAPEPQLTPGQRRIARQAAALAAGRHPLSLTVVDGLGLHAEAAPADDKAAPGRRCGSCRFRVLAGGHARDFPKCRYPDPDTWPGRGGWPRETSGGATDVRAWWPACPQHEPVGGGT